MRKNEVRRNAKRTGVKAAVLMAAILAVGTPFAIHTYNAQCQANVQVVDADTSTGKTASGSQTASSKVSQKAKTAAVTEKTTAATTETSAKSTTSTGTTASAKNTSKNSSAARTTANTYSVESRNMTVYGTAQSGLNIRNAADASAKAIGTLAYRESIKVTGLVLKDGRDTGWYRVSYNGNTGYVKAAYVSTTQPAAPKKEDAAKKSEVDTLTLTRMMGNGEVRTVCFWSDGSITDGNGVTYTAINGYEYKSSDGYQWVEGYQVDTMILYQVMGDDVREVAVWSDNTIYDGNGVYYTAINGCEYTSTDGYQWTTEKAEKEEESGTWNTVTMTVKVNDGYLALRSSADSDSDNEIAQLNNDVIVEASKEGLNACDKYVHVYVPSTGMSGYVNVNFLQ